MEILLHHGGENRMDKQVIKSLVGKEDPVIFEIGAHNGSDTQGFLDIFEKGRFYCFEPDPRAWLKLNDNIKDTRCKKYQYAVSDKVGLVDFHMSSGQPDNWPVELEHGWDYSGSIKKPKLHLERHPWCKFEQTIKINTMTLDKFVADNNANQLEQRIDIIDFVWCDCQGAERNVIEGAREALKKTRYLYTEYSDEELYEGEIGLQEILDLLPNFVMLQDFGTDVLLKNRKL